MWRISSEKAHLLKSLIKTGVTKSKESIKTAIALHGIKAGLGILAIGIFVEEEKTRARKRKHLIIGKRGSGLDLVGNAILGIGSDKSMLEKELRQSFRGIKAVQGFNKKLRRNINMTFVYMDDVASSSENYLSSPPVLEEDTVVYCFPVSCRFTVEDWNLLQRYIKGRDQITFAFTYRERLDGDPKDYIENLPEEMKDVLSKYGDKYIFIRSDGQGVEENERNAQTLITSPLSSDFRRKIVVTLGIVILPPVVIRFIVTQLPNLLMGNFVMLYLFF